MKTRKKFLKIKVGDVVRFTLEDRYLGTAIITKIFGEKRAGVEARLIGVTSPRAGKKFFLFYDEIICSTTNDDWVNSHLKKCKWQFYKPLFSQIPT